LEQHPQRLLAGLSLPEASQRLAHAQDERLDRATPFDAVQHRAIGAQRRRQQRAPVGLAFEQRGEQLEQLLLGGGVQGAHAADISVSTPLIPNQV
jgi:hypothetical protein